jgi:O-antigen/teichoic acid export membrane protein
VITGIRKIIYRTTKKAGDKIGIDLPYLVENGFWVTANQLVTSLMAFVLLVVNTRFLTKEILGQYQLMLSILGILSIFSLPGLNTSVARSVAKGFEKSYDKAVQMSLKWSMLSIPVFIGVAFWYYFQGDEIFSIVIILSGIFFYQIFGFNTWTSFWNGKAKFERFAKQMILQNLVLNILLILAVIIFKNNLLIISSLYLIITASFNTLWHFSVRKLTKNSAEDSECISYGKYMSKINLLGVIVIYFDKIIIGFLDVELLAVYVIAIKLFDTVKEFIRSFHNISFPKFAKKEVTISGKYIFLLIFSGLFSTVILYFFAETLITFFFTDNYADSITIFKKLIFVLPLVFVSPLFANKASAQQDKKKIYQTYVLAPFVAMLISISILLITNNLEYFVISKVFVLQIAYFVVLVPIFGRKKSNI